MDTRFLTFLCLLITLTFTSLLAANTSEVVTKESSFSLSINQDAIAEAIHAADSPRQNELIKFYAQRDYRHAWSTGKDLNLQAHALLHQIKNAETFGLRANIYFTKQINELVAPGSTRSITSAELDVMLTYAYLKYAEDLSFGKANYESVEKLMGLDEYDEFIQELAIDLDSRSIAEILRSVQPKHDTYIGLLRALRRYKGIEDNISPIEFDNKLIEIDDLDASIIQVRKKIALFGDYKGANLESALYDEGLAKAVAHFQDRHGLKIDEVIGPNTLKAINRPLTDRIRQLEINLDRARGLPKERELKYLIVNVPEIQIEIY